MTEQSGGAGAGGQSSGASASAAADPKAVDPSVGVLGASELAFQIASRRAVTPGAAVATSGAIGDRRRPWRAVVAEESMAPALEPGDWLLLDPTIRRWPRRGTIVVVREPHTGQLAIKRVAARPGDGIRTATGVLILDSGDAWLLGDNAADSIDSRRYGPVPLDALVARAWFRYGPPGRIGRIGRR